MNKCSIFMMAGIASKCILYCQRAIPFHHILLMPCIRGFRRNCRFKVSMLHIIRCGALFPSLLPILIIYPWYSGAWTLLTVMITSGNLDAFDFQLFIIHSKYEFRKTFSCLLLSARNILVVVTPELNVSMSQCRIHLIANPFWIFI